MDITPILRIDKLTWSYPNHTSPVFKNLNVQVDAWSFCFVVWKSGVWKTTLTKFLIRELKPPVWTIFHHRDDIARYTPAEVQAYRKKLGIIFQDGKLLQWKTVKENILYPLMLDQIWKEQQDTMLQTVLTTVGLTWKEECMPEVLSGWEKQRVAIARALIRNPEIIIADEPTGNIDHETSREIADKMIEINKTWTTILFITHDTQLIEYVQSKHPTQTIIIE